MADEASGPGTAPDAGVAATLEAPHGGARAGIAELTLFGVVAIVTVLLAVALVIRLDDRRSDPAGKSRSQALTAGATGAAALLSYDYRTVDRLATTNRELLTAACAAGYAGQLNDAVKADVTKNQVVLSATVRSVAVETLDANQASVLVVVDEKRVGSDLASAQSSQLAVSVMLLRDGKRWLVDDLVPAGSTAASGSGSAQHCG